MKYLLITFNLLISCIHLQAQIRQMPYLQLPEQIKKNKDVANGKTNKITQISCLVKNNKLDTVSLFIATYYPSGFLKTSEYYKYSTKKEATAADPIFKEILAKVTNKLHDGSRVEYTYDANNNLILCKGYKSLLKNSSDALEKIMEHFYDRGAIRYMEPVTLKDTIGKYVDSLVRTGVPGVAELEKETQYVYNGDNNVIYSKEQTSENDVLPLERHFSYGHYPDGRVQFQRIVYKKSSTGPWLMTAQMSITYATNGLPASVITYLAEDTGNIAVEKNMLRKEEFQYNKNGLIERAATFEKANGLQKVTLVSYKDSLKTKTIEFFLDQKTGKADTSSRSVFSYKKGMTFVMQYRYSNNKFYLVEREEMDTNNEGLTTELRTYTLSLDSKKPEQLASKKLYVYEKE